VGIWCEICRAHTFAPCSPPPRYAPLEHHQRLFEHGVAVHNAQVRPQRPRQLSSRSAKRTCQLRVPTWNWCNGPAVVKAMQCSMGNVSTQTHWFPNSSTNNSAAL